MKRLVICCDGTWQRLYGGALTNVALTARAVSPHDRSNNPQIVYYSMGVGASLSGLSLWQGMTGDDLDDHLLDAYLFLNLNYEPGDQIYLFGFSRGAYTVRSLAGLLRKCGVLRRAHVDKARDALDLYRRRIASDSHEAARFRLSYAAAWPHLSTRFSPPPVDLSISYLGVWDTVGALGIPRVLPLSIGLNKQYQFHDTSLSRSVRFARHALAIDERRPSFAPTLWSNLDKINIPGAPVRAAQAWFPGDHGGVGGNDITRGLSNCALLWVLEGAEQAGLAFAREPGSVLSGCLANIDPIGSPLSGANGLLGMFGARWRSGLRKFEDVHETARLRWAANADYRPAPLAHLGAAILRSVREAA